MTDARLPKQVLYQTELRPEAQKSATFLPFPRVPVYPRKRTDTDQNQPFATGRVKKFPIVVAALALTACASEQPPDPVITSFSANHVTIAAPDWPGHMAYEYCRTQGKGELLVSRDGGRYHFACLAREYLSGEDEGDEAGERI